MLSDTPLIRSLRAAVEAVPGDVTLRRPGAAPKIRMRSELGGARRRRIRERRRARHARKVVERVFYGDDANA